ncbi:hypothetical protein PDJAM_G00065370 [Pangasius djambal]|uniref:Uncharacterized protein n=1 Tax=Pangasius djambal TaxID=1691987 RepID=A0ACC5YZC9_9TELE|nr:hypothetical protein [Pangasius djambal]
MFQRAVPYTFLLYSSGQAAVSNPLLDQLPSYQSLLYRRKSSGSSKRRSSTRGRYSSTSSSSEVAASRGGGVQDRKWAYGRGDRTIRAATEDRPARELPWSMEEKRKHRELQQHRELGSCSSTESWVCVLSGESALVTI